MKTLKIVILTCMLVFILRGVIMGQKQRIQVEDGEIVLLGRNDVMVNPYSVNYKNWAKTDGFLGTGQYRFLAQDALGYIWFWHDREGLFRYNGISNEKFGETKGFLGEEVHNGTVDNAGNIWLATANGLWEYDIKTGKFARFLNPHSVDKDFGAINLLSNGTLWISTTGKKVYTWVFDPVEKQFLHRLSVIFKHPENRIDSNYQLYVYGPVHIDKDSVAWFFGRPSGHEGLYSINLRQNRGETYIMSKMYWKDAIHPEMKELNGAMVVFADSDSIHFWIGYWFGGLRKYNKNTHRWTQYTARNHEVNGFNTELILSISEKNNDELWINGFSIFNKKTETYQAFPYDKNQPFGFRQNSMTTQLTTDGYNGYWATGQGVTYFSPLFQRFQLNPPLIVGKSKDFGCYDTKNNKLLMPIRSSDKQPAPSIVQYDWQQKTFNQTFYPQLLKIGLLEQHIIKIIPSKKNTGFYWVLTSNGLFELDCQNMHLRYHPLRINREVVSNLRDIDEDSKGSLWIARADYNTNYEGTLLLSYQPNNKSITTYSFKKKQHSSWFTFSYAQSVFCDSKGFIWIGSAPTWQGINILNPQTNEVKSYQCTPTDSTTLSNNIVTQFKEDSYGRIWLKTDGGFCYKTAESPTFQRILGFKGVSNNFVFDNRGYLWVSNSLGLSCYDTLNRQWRMFNEQHSLTNYDNSIITNENGSRIFIGTDVEFSPSVLDQKAPPPNIVIESFNVFDKPLLLPHLPHFMDKITLKYEQNFFSIGFVGVGFYNPEETQYAYQLVGVEPEWVQAGTRRTAFYTNISAGEYTFNVKAMNGDGVWSAVKILKISVLPPWWQTWWFRILAAVLIGSGLWFFYQNRLQQVQLQADVKQKETELLQKEAEFRRSLAETEMSALRAQMNPHFIFNCLNSINNYMLDNNGLSASLYLTKFSRLIRLVLENSRTEKVSLANEMDALELYMEMEALRFKEKLRYTINVHPSVQTDFIEIPPLLLQPYVENAIWHGLMHRKEGGMVTVNVTQPNENILHIEIADDGIGREAAMELKSRSATRRKSFGMQITSERLQAINDIFGMKTEVTIQDKLGTEGQAAGTKVIIEIPC